MNDESRKKIKSRINRGVAVADGKVFFETLDAPLLALDAKSGKVV